MSNAATFALEIDKFFTEEVEGQTLLVTQKLGMEALSRVVLRSPVDTGRFRGNWTVSINQPDGSMSDAVDPAGGATIAKGASAITGIREPRIVYVQNNLPYAERLENGWSKQAPAGVVAVTFAELTAFFA